jgi:hypothetical protein
MEGQPKLKLVSESRKVQAKEAILTASYPIALRDLLKHVEDQGFSRTEALGAFYSLSYRKIKKDRQWIVHKLN